ncbi:MAG: nucleotidyltransferase domain-containing protein [Nanoarchaeota archaeon]
MITKKQLKILSVFLRNEFREYTYKEIRELSKEKSNSVIQNAIKSFLKEDLIIERKIGTSKLYLINHNNNKVYSYFEIYINENLGKEVKYTLNLLEESLNLNLKSFFYSIVIFGSYATGEQTKKSDIDIAVFIFGDGKKKITENVLHSLNTKSILKVDGHAITQEEFLEMLKIDQENLGKQIARKHLIVYNPQIFYSLIKEGMKNGFKL